MPHPTVNIGLWHQAILDHFKDHFAQQVLTVEAYAPDAQTWSTPALLLEMEHAQAGQDAGDGRHPLQCRMTLHCVLSLRTANVQMEIRLFATDVWTQVRHNTWRCHNVRMPVDIAMGPGQFQPGQEGYESWYVTWEQTIDLGEALWQTDEVYQGKVFLRDQRAGDDYAPLAEDRHEWHISLRDTFAIADRAQYACLVEKAPIHLDEAVHTQIAHRHPEGLQLSGQVHMQQAGSLVSSLASQDTLFNKVTLPVSETLTCHDALQGVVIQLRLPESITLIERFWPDCLYGDIAKLVEHITIDAGRTSVDRTALVDTPRLHLSVTMQDDLPVADYILWDLGTTQLDQSLSFQETLHQTSYQRPVWGSVRFGQYPFAGRSKRAAIRA